MSLHRTAAITAVTSNLLAYLESCPYVTDIKLSSNAACSESELKIWTRMNAPHRLPADVTALLSMADGLKVQWGIQSSSNNISASIEIGCVDICALKDWRRCDEGTPPGAAFVIQTTLPFGYVCLVFVPTNTDLNKPPSSQDKQQQQQQQQHAPSVFPQTTAEIWFYEVSSRKWFPLAQSLSAYFRLMVVHLGVKGWQMGWTDTGMPQSTLDWLAMYATSRVELYRRHRAAQNWKIAGGTATMQQSAGIDHVPFDAEKLRQLVATAKALAAPKVEKPATPSNKRPVTR